MYNTSGSNSNSNNNNNNMIRNDDITIINNDNSNILVILIMIGYIIMIIHNHLRNSKGVGAKGVLSFCAQNNIFRNCECMYDNRCALKLSQ